MKKIGFFIVGIVAITSTALAQDTIYTVVGEKQCVKVYEVTPTEIKYKKTSNLDGPMYTVNKNTIALIEYKNGSKEVYGTGSNSSVDPSNDPNNPAVVNNNYYNQQQGYNGGPRIAIALGGYYGYRSFFRGGPFWAYNSGNYYRGRRHYYHSSRHYHYGRRH